jgi:hypothetical protein
MTRFFTAGAARRSSALIAVSFVLVAAARLNGAEFYNDWATNHLSGVPSQSGPTNDPDSDGVVNLAEYTFGTDPMVSDGGTSIFALPPETNGIYRVEILERAGHRYGVQIDLDAAADLNHWIRPWWIRTVTNSLPGDPTNSVRELFTTYMPDTNLFFVRASLHLFDPGPEIANYYVATNGNNSNSGTDIDHPFATLSNAVAKASAGNLIYVRGGTYLSTGKISISKSGTESQPYRVRAYPGEHPILDFSGQATGNDAISITGAYWEFDDIEIYNAGHNGVKIQGGSTAGAGSHNTFKRCIFRGCRDTGFNIGSSSSQTYLPGTNLILNCDAYRNYDTGAHGGNADGFAAKYTIGTGNVFRGCRAWENSDDGWDLWMANAPVLIDTCWTWRNGSNFWNDTNWGGNGNGFKLGGNYIPGAHTLVNSIAYSNVGTNGGYGIDQNNNTTNLTVVNNISWANITGAINLNHSSSKTEAHLVANNVVLWGTVQFTSNTTQLSNTWQVISGNVTTNDFVSLDDLFLTAPRKDDGSLPDTPFARPVPNGRLVDQGTNILGQTFSGSAPDLGAFESPVW